jgi:hypothetical protein
VRVFAFVDRQKAEFAVRTLCRVCQVSTSGFYAWAARAAAGPSPGQVAEAVLVAQIRLVHAESRDNYGEPRVTAQLARDGVVANHKAGGPADGEGGDQGSYQWAQDAHHRRRPGRHRLTGPGET